jgi:hypothetical protein
VKAAQAEEATVSFENVDGAIPQTFVFRTSPGYIFSHEHPYTHANLVFPSKPPLEAHIGVRVEGKSGVLHECDVAVLLKSEAQTCRLNGTSPRQAKVVLATECKFYSGALPLGMARAFLGLVADMSSKDRYLIANTASESVEQLLTHRDAGWEHRVIPGSSTVPRLENQFRQTFKRYKARR